MLCAMHVSCLWDTGNQSKMLRPLGAGQHSCEHVHVYSVLGGFEPQSEGFFRGPWEMFDV